MNAPAPQGVAKTVHMHRSAQRLGHVDGSQTTGGGVDQQAERRSDRRAGPGLQQVVDDHHRLIEVDQEVLDRLAYWSRRQAAGQFRQRSDKNPIEHGVEPIDPTVSPLPRVARRVMGRGGRGSGPSRVWRGADNQQDHREKGSAHQGLRVKAP